MKQSTNFWLILPEMFVNQKSQSICLSVPEYQEVISLKRCTICEQHLGDHGHRRKDFGMRQRNFTQSVRIPPLLCEKGSNAVITL